MSNLSRHFDKVHAANHARHYASLAAECADAQRRIGTALIGGSGLAYGNTSGSSTPRYVSAYPCTRTAVRTAPRDYVYTVDPSVYGTDADGNAIDSNGYVFVYGIPDLYFIDGITGQCCYQYDSTGNAYVYGT